MANILIFTHCFLSLNCTYKSKRPYYFGRFLLFILTNLYLYGIIRNKEVNYMSLIVKDKKKNKIYRAVSVKNDKNGYPHFLIFNYYGHNEWTWKSAKHFTITQ